MKSRFLIILVILTLSLSACVSLAEDITPPPNYVAPTPRPTSAPTFPENTPNAANGALIYGEKCAACHGDTGLGDGTDSTQLPNPVAALGSIKVAAQASPADWYTMVTDGNLESYMPPFASLTDAERWDVVAYSFSLSTSPQEISIGQEIYEEKCALCHGDDGKGITAPVDFSNQGFMATRSASMLSEVIENGKGTGMKAFADQLSAAELAALTDYLRTFSFNFSLVQNAEAESETKTEEPAPAADGEGATLFAENCALCHGFDGSGVTVQVDLRDAERMGNFPDAMLFALISEGNESGMPPFAEKLDESEIETLVAYLRELAAPLAESTDDGDEQAENESALEVEGVGTVMGSVINATGGELPEGITIELQAYDHDLATGAFSETFSLETSLDADGNYLFEDVEIFEGRAFLAVAVKGDVRYSSQPSFVSEGNTTLELPIDYYETSTDASELTFDRLHIFFEPPNTEEDFVQVVEVFIISNPTLYAISSEEGQAVIEFPLPEGATNIQFEDGLFGDRYTQTEDGFGDTATIFPGVGSQEVIVFFELPYKRKLDFSQKIDRPTGSAIVMSPEGLKVKSDYLQESGEREAQGLIYKTYSSQPLPVGSNFEMNVSGKVSASATSAGSNPSQNLIYGVLALGVVLIGAGAWFYMQSKDDDEDDEDEDVEFESAETLMDSIIALDDAYRAGDLSEDAYKKRRAELKAQLKDLV